MKYIILFVLIFSTFLPRVSAQNNSLLKDTLPDINIRGAKPKPYREVITTKALSDTGLFTVHQVDGRYYFEIPDSLLERDILSVNRIAEGAADIFTRPMGYAGDEIGQKVIRFIKGPNNKIFITSIFFGDVARDTSENGLYRSVFNSNLQPIVAAFDIKAFAPDSTAVVIDLTDYLKTDNDVFFFDNLYKKAYYLGPSQQDKSYIESIKTYPVNIEMHTVKTYLRTMDDRLITYGLNSSLILLPKTPMKPRYQDKRIGFFGTSYRDFDADPQSVKSTTMVTRWRLEPSAADKSKYEQGILVEPEKPIVFYIDATTPKKWVPYLIQGVNDWQVAFEKAGFKHAIYALPAPVNDPSWNLEDSRHNAIVYKPSIIMNASGPHVHDPRSGEILETHVNWYHNVLQLLHDWYFIQAGAVDPKARNMQLDDTLMGQLIRFVSSHEVGHTLGLMHNFGASSTIPVKYLRNKKWVEANGFCPSIMDYARFNYVAQPQDSISENGLMPRIGAYDKWAIEWGYRWFPDSVNQDRQKELLNKWVTQSQQSNPFLWFGSEQLIFDPRCQSEDLGDDAVKASEYGIENLKRIEENLVHWVHKPGEDYGYLERMQAALIEQYKLYLMHVAKNIGGVLRTEKTMEQQGPVITFVNLSKQKSALDFLQKQLFITPKWILDKQIFSLIGRGGLYQLLLIQQDILKKIMSHDTFKNLMFFETNKNKEAYTTSELLTELEKGIWSELTSYKVIDIYRRNLQKVYVNQLIELLNNNDAGDPGKNAQTLNNFTDVHAILVAKIKMLHSRVSIALPHYKDSPSILHLKDIQQSLKGAFDKKS